MEGNSLYQMLHRPTSRFFAYLTANGRHANCFHKLDEGSQYSTDRKTTLSSSPPTETITYQIPYKVLTQKYWHITGLNNAVAMFF